MVTVSRSHGLRQKKPPAIASGLNIDASENETNLPGLKCYQLSLRGH